MHCVNLFRCKGSQICIHVEDVCDGKKNCPLGDDEFLCLLKGKQCLMKCKCLNLAIVCESLIVFENHLSSIPYVSTHFTNVAITRITLLRKGAFYSIYTWCILICIRSVMQQRI